MTEEEAKAGRTRTTLSKLDPNKPIFTLSVAADILGLHPRTLRIYEENGLVVPARTPTNRRRYSQNDVKRFQFIQHLTQGRGVNLAGVKIILEMIEELRRCGVDYSEILMPNYKES
jgi:MerR family transcriptional regulator, heat shock protein HspR